MLAHLEWLVAPVRETHPDLRFEIAHGLPERGPCCAKTFKLAEVIEGASYAAWANGKLGHHVYLGATLKHADTAIKGRTKRDQAALSGCLPIDIDGDFLIGARRLGMVAKPQLCVVTGRTPEPRGQFWIRTDLCEDLSLWAEVNKRSVAFSGGDQSALGCYRVVRLAGSVSYPSKSKQARGYVVEGTALQRLDGPVYDLRALVDRFPEPQPSFPGAPARWSAARATCRNRLSRAAMSVYDRVPVNRTNVAIVQSMLDMLPGEYADNYDLWLRVGFSLHDFNDGEIGFALFRKFSERRPEKSEATDFERLWPGFGRDYGGDKITLGWLRAQAQACGWRAPRHWDRSKAA